MFLDSTSTIVYAFPIVSGICESLPAVCGSFLFSAKVLARFQVMEWSMLAELITSIALGIVVRISGFNAERRKSYGCATIETPPSRLILAPGFTVIVPASFQFGFFPWKMLRWICVAVIGRNGWSCIPIVPTIWAATPRV